MNHGNTWMHDAEGNTGFTPFTSGVVCSVHWPETLLFPGHAYETLPAAPVADRHHHRRTQGVRGRLLANGKKSFLLIENHSFTADMIEPMDRHLPEVLQRGADLYLYYYYPRNVAEPDRTMEVLGRHLGALRRKA
jgi:hypothetical protein